ncbi:MAG TPA: CpXC domain-containing protein [Kofleriaceae bacterium]|nr:CpXC domain-containing protein [Kofleriaceae bacterium]
MSSGPGLSQARYRGPLGATRREHVHHACDCGVLHSVDVVVAVDSQTDPLLARRLRDGDPGFNSTVCPHSRVRSALEVAVVYHDPINRVFVLVLPESARVRELKERAALLLRLADDAAHAVPPYVVGFTVAYGPAGLRRTIELEAERVLSARRPAAERSAPLPLALVPPVADEPPAGADADLDSARTNPVRALEAVASPAAPLSAPLPAPSLAPPPSAPALPSPQGGEAAREPRGADGDRRVGPGGAVELVLRAGGRELEMLSSPDLEVRLQLHRMSNFPIVALALGTPAALAGEPGAGPPRWVELDVGDAGDAAVLDALAGSFAIALEVRGEGEGDEPVARARLSPPLTDNAAAVRAAAGDYMVGIPPGQRSFARGRAGFRAADHDRLGTRASHAAERVEDALGALSSPAEVMRAVALVKRFSQPTGEDWLIMIRSFPLPLWQEARRAVVVRALELGIWPGPVAAQIAVGDGLARSRKDLVGVLQRHFSALTARAGHGLGDELVRDNWKALRAEARALGLPVGAWPAPRSEPIMSESEPVASGTIGDPGTSIDFMPPAARLPVVVPLAPGSGDEAGWSGTTGSGGRRGAVGEFANLDAAVLIGRLGDRGRRQAAAVELCRRGEPSALQPVFGALESMTRAESSGVLASTAGFGRAAEPHLLAGLRSRKAYLRQGAALALAVMKSEAGVEAICELLLDEPTEVWRELARAVGEAGPAAVMPLAARLGERSEAARERAAWAMAHIAARGARRPIETVAGGRDPVAAGVARAALELVERAAADDLQVRGDRAPRDQTLNRAYSRRFLEAVEAERRAEVAAAGQRAGDTAESPVLLDEPLDEGPGEADAGSQDEEDAPDAADAIVAEFARSDDEDDEDEDEDGGQDDEVDAELDAAPGTEPDGGPDAEPDAETDAETDAEGDADDAEPEHDASPEERAGAEGSDRAPS